jgi:hypothetical protein
VDAIEEVVRRIRLDYPQAGKILWITLREEPVSVERFLPLSPIPRHNCQLVYINGAPHCLRRERFTLRNIKGRSIIDEYNSRELSIITDYGGISASRLEALEDRLGNDVQAELEAFGGRYVLRYSVPVSILKMVMTDYSCTPRPSLETSFPFGRMYRPTVSPLSGTS